MARRKKGVLFAPKVIHVPGGDYSKCPADVRALVANRATTLGVLDPDRAGFQRAFADFGLDPANPWHWRALAWELVAERYPRIGRPPRRDGSQFATDYHAAVAALRKRGVKNPTRLQIAERMKARDRRRYWQDVETLVKHISKKGMKRD